MITVLLVEDHASYRQALDAVMRITEDLRVSAHVERADEVLEAVAATGPDVAVIDLDLPGGGGLTALQAVRGAHPSVYCLVLTALTDDIELGRAIELGASAVLHKSIEIPALLDAIRVVAGGGTVLPPEETSRRLQALAASRNQQWYAEAVRRTLSPREIDVLQRLAQGESSQDIARGLSISPQTVQTHVRNLHAKLDVGSRLEAVAKAIRLGLVSPPR